MKADSRSSALPQGSFGGIPRMTEDEAGLASPSVAKLELANRLFFRLYQCANMLHKTGSRAVEAEGLTTQQWAVLGALSRKEAEAGVSIGDLARYLMMSRQNLAGLLGFTRTRSMGGRSSFWTMRRGRSIPRSGQARRRRRRASCTRRLVLGLNPRIGQLAVENDLCEASPVKRGVASHTAGVLHC